MAFALSRVIELEDFDEPLVKHAIREVFAHEAARAPEFPAGKEHRKQWEVAMAVLSLRDGGALREDAEVLGIGAGSEATLFWLTNHVHRVWATDLYADPGKWIGTAPPTMLTNPGDAWVGPWNPRRLVVQHMDACELCYEDETFDGIFSSGSIEHFGSLDRIAIAMDEAFRVLKPGGTASFSTEFLIEGDPLEFENDMVMFTPELIDSFLVGERDWVTVTPIDYTLTEATIATEIDTAEYFSREQRGDSVHPHCALRVGSNLITSVHLALRKSDHPSKLPPRKSAPPRGSAASSSRIEAQSTGSRPPAASPVVSPVPQGAQAHASATLQHVSSQHAESNFKRVARRLARPVLSPIDGRVADINRRVDYHGSTIERTLGAYAHSSSEASSYIGVELRRVHDQLAGLQDQLTDFGQRSLEEYYHMRLAQASDLPLEKLDGALAQTINEAMTHRGFYAQAGLWFNPPIAVTLTAGGAIAATVTERIVELPFAMAALSRLERAARILDVGSAESTFPLSAASLGYKVTAIDPRPLVYSHPNLESHASLLEEWEGPAGLFAAAFLISTIEHVGLGAYGEGAYGSREHGGGADVALLERVRKLLSPEGLLVLTAPYGKRDITELERIYDEESLNKLLTGWEVLERQIVARRDALTWEADDKVVTGARGVVMVIASPTQSQ
jgi:SAM-dependent methyltransferase